VNVLVFLIQMSSLIYRVLRFGSLSTVFAPFQSLMRVFSCLVYKDGLIDVRHHSLLLLCMFWRSIILFRMLHIVALFLSWYVDVAH